MLGSFVQQCVQTKKQTTDILGNCEKRDSKGSFFMVWCINSSLSDPLEAVCVHFNCTHISVEAEASQLSTLKFLSILNAPIYNFITLIGVSVKCGLKYIFLIIRVMYFFRFGF